MNRLYTGCVLILLCSGIAAPALAEMSAEELAKLAQKMGSNDPIQKLIMSGPAMGASFRW